MIVEIVKRFKKDYKNTSSVTQKRVMEVIKVLQVADSLEETNLDIEYMKGQKSHESYYRIRVGDYRIGCEYFKPNIVLLRVLTRGEIYKHFPPK